MNTKHQSDGSTTHEILGGPPSADLGGEGVRPPTGPENANQSTHIEKISAKGPKTGKRNAGLEAYWAKRKAGVIEPAASKAKRGRPKGSKNAGRPSKAVPMAKAPPKAESAGIDYDRLAEALLRAQKRENEMGEMRHEAFRRGGPDAVREFNAKLPGYNGHDLPGAGRVAPSNNPVQRILLQLNYPADKEGQVVAMIAANMAPSWDGNNMEVEDRPYPPVHEAALVAHMQEYCAGLRAELPKTRLEPKYQLRGGV